MIKAEEKIRRSVVISILSRGWASAIALLTVPLYMRFIGLEAYGVLGLFTSFSILVSFLDLGLGGTLTRELANLSTRTGALADSRDTVRTFELVYASIALLIGLVIILCSVPVAQYWVKAQLLDRSEIAHALALAGVALACQWPTNLYIAGLAGVHRQAQLGIATMAFATFRAALTLVAVWWKPGLESFFWAQIAVTLVQTLGMRWLLWRALVMVGHRPKPRMSIIRSSFHFAGGMAGIATTSIILTQTDKLILSKVLNLADFGTYVVAGTLATGLYVLISPLFAVMYPRFSALVHAGDTLQLIDLFHTSSQLMAALVLPLAIVVAVFAHEVLYLWTGDIHLSQQGAGILGFLIMGNALNGLMNIPYAIQLAFGWTSLPLYLNVIYIATLMPAILWATINYGAVGAAAVWLFLNLLCVLIVPQLMHRLVLRHEKQRWYLNSFFIPMLISAPFFMLFRMVQIEGPRGAVFFLILMSWLILCATLVFSLPKTRRIAVKYATRYFKNNS